VTVDQALRSRWSLWKYMWRCPSWEIYGLLGIAAERGNTRAVRRILSWVRDGDLNIISARARQCGFEETARVIESRQ